MTDIKGWHWVVLQSLESGKSDPPPPSCKLDALFPCGKWRFELVWMFAEIRLPSSSSISDLLDWWISSQASRALLVGFQWKSRTLGAWRKIPDSEIPHPPQISKLAKCPKTVEQTPLQAKIATTDKNQPRQKFGRLWSSRLAATKKPLISASNFMFGSLWTIFFLPLQPTHDPVNPHCALLSRICV